MKLNTEHRTLKTFTFLCALCAYVVNGFAADVVIRAQDFTQQPAALRRVMLSPIGAARINGTNLLTREPRTGTTSADGVLTLSNVLAGSYTLSLAGSPATVFALTVPETNAVLDAATLVTTNATSAGASVLSLWTAWVATNAGGGAFSTNFNALNVTNGGTFGGSVTAGAFIGNGSGLTNTGFATEASLAGASNTLRSFIVGTGAVVTNLTLDWVSTISAFTNGWLSFFGTNFWTNGSLTANMGMYTNQSFGVRWSPPFQFSSNYFYTLSMEVRTLQASGWQMRPYWGAYPLFPVADSNLNTLFTNVTFSGYGAASNTLLYLWYAPNDGAASLTNTGSSVIGFEVRNITLARFRPTIVTNFSTITNRQPWAEIQLPSTVYALPGVERNFYWRNIIDYSGIGFDELQFWTAGSTAGTNMQDGFRWTPPATNAPTTNTFSLSVYCDYTNLMATKTVTMIAGALTNAATRKALFIGDSTLASGAVTLELLNTFTNDPYYSLTLLGTVDGGGGTNRHEGRGGYAVATYWTNTFTNPFFRTGYGFDFNYYLTNNSYTMSAGDWVVFRLGINDAYGYTTDATLQSSIATSTNLLDKMVTNVLATVSGVRVGISLVIAASTSQDSFGANYGAASTAWRYQRNRAAFNRALLTLFTNRAGIYLIDDNSVVDGANNMITTSQQINARNTNTVVRQSNALHPDGMGANQIADLWRAVLKTLR